LRDNSWAICSFDTLSPIKYRHKIHTTWRVIAPHGTIGEDRGR
jgi:hypothetical protein